MSIDKTRFWQQLRLLAKLANRPDPDQKAGNFMWSRLRDLDENELSKALGYFGERAEWPSVERILEYCGCRAAGSEDLRQAPTSISPEWDVYGEIVFRAIGDEAISEYRQKMQTYGWEILDTRETTIPVEEKVGRIVRRRDLRVVEYLASRRRKAVERKPLPSDLRSPVELVAMLNKRIRSRYASRRPENAENIGHKAVENGFEGFPSSRATESEENERAII